MARIMTGKVVSDKSDKSIVVAVESRLRHPLYDKAYVSTKKIVVHDENNQAGIGDWVEIAEGRAVSKRKSWHLAKVVEKNQESK